MRAVRISREQSEAAEAARAKALKEDRDFHQHDEELQREVRRDGQTRVDTRKKPERKDEGPLTLQPVFALTPRNSYHFLSPGNSARIYCLGAVLWPHLVPGYRFSFDHQNSSNELFLSALRAGARDGNYRYWSNRRIAPYIHLFYDLSDFTQHERVALTFRFDAVSEARIQIYSDAEKLDEEVLHPGNDQFLINVEATDSLNLFFVHVGLPGLPSGGHWFFQGIDGHVA